MMLLYDPTIKQIKSMFHVRKYNEVQILWGKKRHFCFTKVYMLNNQRIQHDNMVIDSYLKCLLW